ncbi:MULTISPECIES: hypothetical protein [unclassified Bradyrhizobium]|uniref:hypothetical protein n=1 Tax=unclassified Bradyrhizobium TaxID=2631580 RepID=UPI001FFBC698|nr:MULTISPECIES: hypothetical protein [unclassified Bradyrhizobium]
MRDPPSFSILSPMKAEILARILSSWPSSASAARGRAITDVMIPAVTASAMNSRVAQSRGGVVMITSVLRQGAGEDAGM